MIVIQGRRIEQPLSERKRASPGDAGVPLIVSFPEEPAHLVPGARSHENELTRACAYVRAHASSSEAKIKDRGTVAAIKLDIGQ